MSRAELLAWVEFYKRYPFDDYARFYRPAAIQAHAMTGEPVESFLDWLERKPAPAARFNATDLSMMQALGMKPPGKD